MVSPQSAAKEVNKAAKNVPQQAEDILSQARTLGEEGLDYLRSGLDEVQGYSSRAVEFSEDTIKSNPFFAIAGAAALGLVAGYLLTRGNRN